MAPRSGIDSNTPSKRARPGQSCVSYRTCKLKCDRERPDGQCERSSTASNCIHDGHIGSLSAAGASLDEGPRKRLRIGIMDEASPNASDLVESAGEGLS